jgi:hypothetical protein
MIEITITGCVAPGDALLYEKRKQQGRRIFVPTYRAHARCKVTGKQFDFAVTRDSSALLFGRTTERFGELGECPPSAHVPYMGTVREDGAVGFRVELFEQRFEHTRELMGQGDVRRRFIQIHFGAACAEGCMMVAGRRRLYPRVFERPLRRMLEHTQDIRVIVEPRHPPIRKPS